MRVHEGLCVLGACYLVCQDPVNYYFTLFYCLLDLSCGQCNVISWYGLCFCINVSVCFVCCVSDSFVNFFCETIRNMFGYGCYFVVE